MSPRPPSKIKSQAATARFAAAARTRGQKVVFTNGCFDIIHYGHISYLRQAKQAGDLLIVGLNSDRSVRKLKGAHRPVFSERDRAEILSELACVDCVTIFHEHTPLQLISKIKPHVLIKGSDWSRHNIVGREIVQQLGGIVRRIPFMKGRSTTRALALLRKSSHG